MTVGQILFMFLTSNTYIEHDALNTDSLKYFLALTLKCFWYYLQKTHFWHNF